MLGRAHTARAGLAGSLLLHGVLVAAVLWWPPTIEKFTARDNAVSVDVVTLDAFNARYTPSTHAGQETAQSERAPAPPPDNKAMPLLKAARIIADSDAAARLAQLEDPRPLARPTPRFEPPRRLKIGPLRALLNKLPDAPEGAPQSPQEITAAAPQTGGGLSAREVDALRRQIRSCWNLPAGGHNQQTLNVLVRVHLSPDGRIRAGPMVVNRTRLDDPIFRTAAESVLRAMHLCQPYKMPIAKYADWRVLELHFDPTTMLGG